MPREKIPANRLPFPLLCGGRAATLLGHSDSRSSRTEAAKMRLFFSQGLEASHGPTPRPAPFLSATRPHHHSHSPSQAPGPAQAPLL